jgi:hypothetical protein
VPDSHSLISGQEKSYFTLQIFGGIEIGIMMMDDDGAGIYYSLVVRAECWHASDLGSNPRPLYIWMYTPTAVSILQMDMYAI